MHKNDEFAPCPNCGSTHAEKINFTWWGGAIGPRLLNHVKCLQCGMAYNGKSGQSNRMGILIYSVVAIIIVVIVFALISGM